MQNQSFQNNIYYKKIGFIALLYKQRYNVAED